MVTKLQKIVATAIVLPVVFVIMIMLFGIFSNYVFIQEVIFVSTLENEIIELQTQITENESSSENKELEDKIDAIKEIIKSNEHQNYSRSLEIADKYILKNESDFVFHNAKGETLLQMKNFDDAISTFELIKMNKNSNPYFLNNLGVSYILKGNYEMANDIFSDTINAIDASEERFSYQVITNSGKNHYLYTITTNNWVVSLIKLEKYEEAKDILFDLIYFERDHYSTYNNLASIFFIQNRLLQADSYLNTAIKYNPNSEILRKNYLQLTSPFLVFLPDIQSTIFKTEIEIKSELVRVVIAPPTVDVKEEQCLEDNLKWIVTADQFVEDRLYEKSIPLYYKAIDCSQNSNRAKVGLAYAYLESGQPEQAVELFKEVISDEPNNLQAKVGLGYFNVINNKHHEGMSLCQEVVDQNNKIFQAHNCIGDAQRKIGDYPKSIDTFQKSLMINPDKNKAHYGLGLVYLLDEQLDLSIKNLENAFEVYPNDINILFLLGRVQYEYEDFSGAKETFEKIKTATGGISDVINIADCFAFHSSSNCFQTDFEKSCTDAIFVYSMAEEFISGVENMDRISSGLGYCYRELGKYDQSVDRYRETLERSPDNWKVISAICSMNDRSELSSDNKRYLRDNCNFR